MYSDRQPEVIDSLPKTAWHREIDLLIKDAVESKAVGSAKVAVMIPPVIYGIGSG